MRSSQRLVRRVRVLAWTVGAAFVPLTGAFGAEASDSPRPVPIGKPLLAAWGFDEAFGGACRDAGGNRCDASLERTSPAALERLDGLFGRAIRLTGRHMLRVPDHPAFHSPPM